MMPPLMIVGSGPPASSSVADHRGRRRLAMRAGDSDRPFEAHQLAQHLGAAHHRQQARARRLDFGIVRLHRRGDHDDFAHRRDSPRHGRSRPECRATAAGGHWRLGGVAALHHIAEIVQDLGDAAHADAADADEMDRADIESEALSCGVLPRASLRPLLAQAEPDRRGASAASGRPSARRGRGGDAALRRGEQLGEPRQRVGCEIAAAA